MTTHRSVRPQVHGQQGRGSRALPPRPLHPTLAGDPHTVPPQGAPQPARPPLAARAAPGSFAVSVRRPHREAGRRGTAALTSGERREHFSLRPTLGWRAGGRGEGRGGTARGPGKGAFAPGACDCAGRARTQPPLTPRVPPTPHLPGPAVLPRGAAGAEPCARRFLLPGGAAGRRASSLTRHGGRRLLPRSARGGRGEPSGRPAARREGARSEPRAPGRAAGWAAPAPAAAPPPRSPALLLFPGTSAESRGRRWIPAGGSDSQLILSLELGDRRGHGARAGPVRMTRVCGEQDRWTPSSGVGWACGWEGTPRSRISIQIMQQRLCFI